MLREGCPCLWTPTSEEDIANDPSPFVIARAYNKREPRVGGLRTVVRNNRSFRDNGRISQCQRDDGGHVERLARCLEQRLTGSVRLGRSVRFGRCFRQSVGLRQCGSVRLTKCRDLS